MSQTAADDEPSEFLSREQFAALAGFSRATLSRYVKAGRVPFFQPGGPRHRMMIPRSALEALTVPAKSRECVAESRPAVGDEPAPPSRKTRRGPKPKWLRNSSS